MVKVKIVVDRLLEPLNHQQEKIKEQFQLYKEKSFHQSPMNFITPPLGVQMSDPSVHPSFGRDTEFEKPDSLVHDIHEYNLSKVHVDTRQKWHPLKEQWNCTSNESVVYSGFLMPCNTYCVVILDFLINGDLVENYNSHNFYSEENINSYLDAADENQNDILGP